MPFVVATLQALFVELRARIAYTYSNSTNNMIKKYTFSIVLLNYNGEKWITRCLESIKNQSFQDFEVIFVDNGSIDNSIDKALEIYPSLKLCPIFPNVGYCVGNNVGAEFAAGEWLILLSNDTWIEKDFLEKLNNHNLYNTSHIFVPKVLQYEENADDRGQNGFIQDILSYGIAVDDVEPFWCLGCAFVVRRSEFFRLGGFDEDYFAFHEDLDLSWRAQLFGLTITSAPNARVHHYGGGTFGKAQIINGKSETTSIRRYLGERNRLTTILKNYSIYSLCVVIPLLLVQTIIAILIGIIFRRSEIIKVYIKAYFWNIKNIKKTLKSRKFIQTMRKRDDIYIFKRHYIGLIELQRFLSFGFPSINKAP